MSDQPLDLNTVGRVNRTIISACDIEWQIPDFFPFSLLDQNTSCSSPPFSFAGTSWLLQMIVNRTGSGSSLIGVFRKQKLPKPSVKVEFSLGLKTSKGREISEQYDYECLCELEYEALCFAKCPTPSEILKRQSQLIRGGTLTVFCCVSCPAMIEDMSARSLHQNFKNVLLHGQNHDLVLKVGGRTLHAHEDILRSRSKVFDSMLSHDMVEKNSGVITAPDCDPDAMEQFLYYVYSGKVETLDHTNMINLYYIADKYDMKDLKDECSDFIRESLSLRNICAVLQLATNHNDSELLESATHFFSKNVLHILRSAEWQTFLKDNSQVANELLIRYFESPRVILQ